MDSTLKQRLIGAAVLAALAIIFLPMLLQGPDVKAPEAANVPIDMPAAPDPKFETREIPIGVPDANAPEGGVLGMPATATPIDAAGDDLADETTLDTAAGTEPAKVTQTAASAAVAAVPVTTPPVVPSVNSAAAAAGNYVVSIGSFSNLDNANALIERLRAQKLPVMADKIQVEGKTTLRVRVGPYADRATAEVARVRSETVTGGSPRVVALDAAHASAKPLQAPAAVTAAAIAAKPLVAGASASVPTAAAKAPAAAPSPTGYAVQLAAPSNEQEANALRDRARAAGFSSFVQRIETADGLRFRVRLGPENDRSAAEKLRDGAAQKLGVTGIVVRHP